MPTFSASNFGCRLNTGVLCQNARYTAADHKIDTAHTTGGYGYPFLSLSKGSSGTAKEDRTAQNARQFKNISPPHFFVF